MRPPMWPIFMLASVVLHAALLVSVGVKSGSPPAVSAKVFSLVDFPAGVSAMLSREPVVTRAEAQPTVPVLISKPIQTGDAKNEIPTPKKNLELERTSPPFYKSSEVSHIAQLQLPLEGVMFSEELSLSGRLVLDIAVSDLGKVVNIDVVEASDPSGALRAHMLPLLRSAPFSPAYKDGKPVNSVRRVEFTLGVVTGDPSLGFNATVSPGFRPKMDERGNVLKDQSK